MSLRVSRRAVLQASALAACGGAAAAIEPLARHSGPKFKFSLAAYSYRDLFKGEKPLSLFDFVDDCARFGLEGTELTSYYFPATVDDAYLRQLRRHAFHLGLDISGTAVGNDFCRPDAEGHKQQLAAVKTWILRAEILGAPVIRIFSGNAKSPMTVEQAHRQAVAAIEECCEFAGQHGVHLALENHGGLTDGVEGMLALVRDVKSPWFGVNVDTGNFHSADVYADLAKIAPYALNVQIKVVVKQAGREREPADLKRLAAIFRESGYRGYIVLEFEEKGDPRQECPRHLDALRAAFA